MNAGVATLGPISMWTDQEVEDMVNVNVGHVTYLLKAMLPYFLERKQRSAIVITSSTSAILSVPGQALYCASKVFEDYLGRGLHYEYKDRLDIMSY